MTVFNPKPARGRVWAKSLRGAVTAAALLLACAPNAFAQASGMFGMAESDAVSAHATVKSVDLQKRTVVLVNDSGETKKLKVGPQVQNLAQVKPGDVVVVQYYDSVAYVVAPPGTKTPEDIMALAAARTVPGEEPGAAVAAKVIVTGLVVGVHPLAHTLSLVNPDGGEVQTFVVRDPEYQAMLANVKVGDTITVVASEAVAVAVGAVK